MILIQKLRPRIVQITLQEGNGKVGVRKKKKNPVPDCKMANKEERNRTTERGIHKSQDCPKSSKQRNRQQGLSDSSANETDEAVDGDDYDYDDDDHYDDDDNTSIQKGKGKRQKKNHVSWTKEEKAAVMKHLDKFLKIDRLPGKEDCLKCILKSHGVLAHRDWLAVKYCLYNIRNRAKRKIGKSSKS